MKITLPEHIIPMLETAKEECLAIMGIYHKYDVHIDGITVTLIPKSGYEESVQDAFALGWYMREYNSY
jgi:alpha-D-ribose 1-methylphosphonate 5-triphosphate synthase subunit PhnL